MEAWRDTIRNCLEIMPQVGTEENGVVGNLFFDNKKGWVIQSWSLK